MSRGFCRSCATMHAASLPRASTCYILAGAKQYEQNCLGENMSLAARHDKKRTLASQSKPRAGNPGNRRGLGRMAGLIGKPGA